MIRMVDALNAWGRPDFEDVLKGSIKQLGAEHLPLQAGLAAGSYAMEKPLDVMVMGSTEKAGAIEAKVGILYKSLMPGCACAGDPTVEAAQNEQITVLVVIDRHSANTRIELLED